MEYSEKIKRMIEDGVIDTSDVIVKCIDSPLQTLCIKCETDEVGYGLCGEPYDFYDFGTKRIEYELFLWNDNTAQEVRIGEVSLVVYRLVNLIIGQNEFLGELDCESYDLFLSAEFLLKHPIFEEYFEDFEEEIEEDPYDTGDVVYIERLYLDEPFRGYGIGNSVIANLARVLDAGHEAEPWFFLTMPCPEDKTKETRDRQIHVLESNGFVKIGEEDNIEYYAKAIDD